MKEIESKMLNILSETTEIDWLIIHRLSIEKFSEIKFSSINKKEKLNEPFKTNLGYITFNNDDYISNYKKIIYSLISKLKRNRVALANLYILISRTSFRGENKYSLKTLFKEELGQEVINNIFELFLISLNKNYFSHLQNIQKKCDTLNSWLELFRDVKYLFNISDILFSIIFLVTEKDFVKIEYKIIKDFKPVIKVMLTSYYNVEIDKVKLLDIINKNIEESSFFSALIIVKEIIPHWVDEDVLKLLLLKYWDNIGKEIFHNIYGISYRNKGKDFSKLKETINKILYEQIQNENNFNKVWLNSLNFPDCFISLFSWLNENKIDFNNINSINKEFITKSLINEFNEIANNFRKYIVSENDYSPFKSYQLNESKYQLSLSYMLLFLITSDEDSFKRYKKKLKKIFFKVKPQFYGGYESTYLAQHFTEIFLLIILSAVNITNIDKRMSSNIEYLLEILSETILIPYIHLIEREEEIWNKETEFEVNQYDIGKYLINDYLRKIYNNENNLKIHFEKLFELFDELKISEWPYERNKLKNKTTITAILKGNKKNEEN